MPACATSAAVGIPAREWADREPLMSWKSQVLFDLCMTTTETAQADQTAPGSLKSPPGKVDISLPLRRERAASARRYSPITPNPVASSECGKGSTDFANIRVQRAKT